MSEAERLRRLEAVCVRDMALLAGVDERPVVKRALWLAFGPRVRRFARDVARFDDGIGRDGIATAARTLAGRYGTIVMARGADEVPRDGPVLLVANHPGLADALAVFATAGRADLRALARPQPLLGLLPELRPHVLTVPDGPGRAGALRAALRHLENGGGLLLFPAGQIEPEPTLLAPHADPLGAWAPGVGSFVRLVVRRGIPLRVVPTAISGVLAESIWRRFRPLIRLRRAAQGQGDLASLLQLGFPRLGRTTAWVRYGEPLDAATLVALAPGAPALTERIRDAVRRRLTTDDGRSSAISGRPSSVVSRP